MRVMVIGSGGREHAIADWLIRDPAIDAVLMADRHDGACQHPDILTVQSQHGVRADYLNQAKLHRPDAVIIGPEKPLVDGLSEQLRAAGFLVVGPGADGAQLEGSKQYSKQFCLTHHIPTAAFLLADQVDEAMSHCEKLGWPAVIKADGLAAGKGVVIANDREVAKRTLTQWLEQASLGDSGKQVVIEHYLMGQEVSIIALVCGDQYRLMTPAKDYKKRDDGDLGPNTGGMGCVAPTDQLTPLGLQQIESLIIQPTLKGLQREGIDYQGWLYFGIMLTANGPYLLEYNCRLGDPEAQVILPLLGCPPSTILAGLAKHQLPDRSAWTHHPGYAMGVVLATHPYPDACPTGLPISGMETSAKDPNALLYHAGTYRDEQGQWRTRGGRVLLIGHRGKHLMITKQKIAHMCKQIHWKGCFYRTDIGT